MDSASAIAAADDGVLLTPDEVRGRLKVSRSFIYQEIKLGRLPAIYFGRLPRISERALADYLARAAKKGSGR